MQLSPHIQSSGGGEKSSRGATGQGKNSHQLLPHTPPVSMGSPSWAATEKPWHQILVALLSGGWPGMSGSPEWTCRVGAQVFRYCRNICPGFYLFRKRAPLAAACFSKTHASLPACRKLACQGKDWVAIAISSPPLSKAFQIPATGRDVGLEETHPSTLWRDQEAGLIWGRLFGAPPAPRDC